MEIKMHLHIFDSKKIILIKKSQSDIYGATHFKLMI